jgi:RHS repeat-associated protein
VPVHSRLSPWRFSSKRVDEKTDLVYYGRRFYQRELGRWLSPDPAGFTDGMNLYAFVHNAPLTHFDEYGLLSMLISSSSLSLEKDPYRVSRNIASRAFREVYDDCIGPFGSSAWNRQNHLAIDRLFGTSFTGFERAKMDLGIQFAYGELPSPGSLAGMVARTSSVYKMSSVLRLNTKSNLRLGQQVHKSYKAAIADMRHMRKEFKLPSGRRIDFLDIKNAKVYELKPNNPRAVRAGMKQLNGYIDELKQIPEFKNKKWEGILEVY